MDWRRARRGAWDLLSYDPLSRRFATLAGDGLGRYFLGGATRCSGCGFAGTAAIFGGRHLGGAAGLALEKAAVACVALSALAGAGGRIAAKRLVEQVPTIVLLRDTGWVVALLSALGWLVLERGRPIGFQLGAVVAFVYLGLVASAAASWLYLELLRRYRVSSVAYLQFLTALVGVASGALIGGERMWPVDAAGAGAVLVGLAVLARR